LWTNKKYPVAEKLKANRYTKRHQIQIWVSMSLVADAGHQKTGEAEVALST
jgi:hypothetical protein